MGELYTVSPQIWNLDSSFVMTGTKLDGYDVVGTSSSSPSNTAGSGS